MGAGTTAIEKTLPARNFGPEVPGGSNNNYENYIYIYVMYFLSGIPFFV